MAIAAGEAQFIVTLLLFMVPVIYPLAIPVVLPVCVPVMLIVLPLYDLGVVDDDPSSDEIPNADVEPDRLVKEIVLLVIVSATDDGVPVEYVP